MDLMTNEVQHMKNEYILQCQFRDAGTPKKPVGLSKTFNEQSLYLPATGLLSVEKITQTPKTCNFVMVVNVDTKC